MRYKKSDGVHLKAKGAVGMNDDLMMVFEIVHGPKGTVGLNAYVKLSDVIGLIPEAIDLERHLQHFKEK